MANALVHCEITKETLWEESCLFRMGKIENNSTCKDCALLRLRMGLEETKRLIDIARNRLFYCEITRRTVLGGSCPFRTGKITDDPACKNCGLWDFYMRLEKIKECIGI